MSEIEFQRDGIDPLRRCPRCGLAVAYEGQDVHREWHESLQAWRGDVERLVQILAEHVGLLPHS